MATRPKGEAATKGENGASGDGAPPEKQQAAVEEDLHRYIAPVVGPDEERIFTDSGIEIKRLYEENDVAPGLQERLGKPGDYPFTRGIHPGMYRDRLWTMRQYAGYATAEESESIFSSRKSRWARIAPTGSVCSSSKWPSSASRRARTFPRSRPLESSASASGSVVPATSASSIARPGCRRRRGRA